MRRYAVRIFLEPWVLLLVLVSFLFPMTTHAAGQGSFSGFVCQHLGFIADIFGLCSFETTIPLGSVLTKEQMFATSDSNQEVGTWAVFPIGEVLGEQDSNDDAITFEQDFVFSTSLGDAELIDFLQEFSVVYANALWRLTRNEKMVPKAGQSGALYLGSAAVNDIDGRLDELRSYIRKQSGKDQDNFADALNDLTNGGTFTSLVLDGTLLDGSGSAGTSGYVLQSTGSGVVWVATSSLGISGGSGSTTVISDLTDVDTSGASIGNVLVFNGSVWVDQATSTLGISLSDVRGSLGAGQGGTGLTTITQNQLLIGGPGNTWTQIATSSLGISGGTVSVLNDLSLTNGYVVRGGAGNTAEATSSLFIADDGSVGIGTTSPGATLHVEGTDPFLVEVLSSSGYLSGAHGINIVGTDVGGSTAYRGLSLVTPYGNGTALSSYFRNTRGSSDIFVGLEIGTVTSHPIRFLTNSTGENVNEHMRITSTGNIGIGTTSPSSKLDVWGDFRVGTSSTSTLFVDTSAGKVGVGTVNPRDYAVLTVGESPSFASYINRTKIWAGLTIDNSAVDDDVAVHQNVLNYISTTAGGSNELTMGTENAIDVSSASTQDITRSLEGTRNYITYDSDVNSLGNIAGTYNIMLFSSNASGNTVDTVRGEQNRIFIQSGSTVSITDAMGSYSYLTADGGSIENLYMYLASTTGNTTSVTNQYGYYVADLIGTNSWGVYQAGSNDLNYFGGNVGIGTTSPTTPLEVYGTATLDGTGGGGSLVHTNSGSTIWSIDRGWDGTGYDKMTLASNAGIALKYNSTSDGLVLDTSGNVGIGTTSPSHKLTVAGGDIHVGGIITSTSTTATSTLPWLTTTNLAVGGKFYDNSGTPGTNGMVLSSTGTGFAWVSTTTLGLTGTGYWSQNGTSVYYSGGNVGIGTSDPETRLSLGTGTGQKLLLWSDAVSARHGFGVDMTGGSYETNMFGAGGSGVSHLSFGFVDIGDGTTYSESMRLLEDTGLGIGTSSPQGNLHVHEPAGGSGANFYLTNESTGSGSNDGFRAYLTSGGFLNLINYEGGMGLYANGSEKVRIDSTGVGIGTTSPLFPLHVYTSGEIATGMIESNDLEAQLLIGGGINRDTKITFIDDGTVKWAMGNDGDTDTFTIGIDGGFGDSSDKFSITADGNIGIGSTSPSTTLSVNGTTTVTNLIGSPTTLSTDANGRIIRTPSDINLKTNVATIENALDTVLGLRGVTFNWKDSERFGDLTEVGFIAQEVDLILPEVVRKGGDYWSLNTPNIVAVVVEAVKEIWTKVTDNSNRIDALEAENELLKERLDALEWGETSVAKSTTKISHGKTTITSGTSEGGTNGTVAEDAVASSTETTMVHTDDPIAPVAEEALAAEENTIDEELLDEVPTATEEDDIVTTGE